MVDDHFYSQSEETLKNRRKGQHLDFAEKKIYRMNTIENIKIYDI